jgi:hypothetical protein
MAEQTDGMIAVEYKIETFRCIDRAIKPLVPELLFF